MNTTPHSAEEPTAPRIVVIGGGYAGTLAANRLGAAVRAGAAQVSLVNPRPHFVHRIRLHQWATGTGAADQARAHRSGSTTGAQHRAPSERSASMSDFVPGLEGVIAFETEIAEPDKDGGALRYRGVDIEELVGRVPFEKIWGLLVDGAFDPGLPPAERRRRGAQRR